MIIKNSFRKTLIKALQVSQISIFEDESLNLGCDSCCSIRKSQQEEFITDIRELFKCRAHGCVTLKSLRSSRPVIKRTPFNDEEILTILKLIENGINEFNFVIDAQTKLDVEYNGLHLTTDFLVLRYF